MRLYLSLLTLITSLLIAVNAQSQDASFVFTGNVYGYHFDTDKGLLKKNEETELEGVLSDVEIVVNENGTPIKTFFTNYKGEFSLSLDPNAEYVIQFSKLGYKNESLVINTTIAETFPAKGVLSYHKLEILLNSYEPEKSNEYPVGQIYFNSDQGHFEFKPNEVRYTKKRLIGGDKTVYDNAAELLSRSVINNRGAKFEDVSTQSSNTSGAWSERQNKRGVNVVEDTSDAPTSEDALTIDHNAFQLNIPGIAGGLESSDIEAQRSAIQNAKQALAEAKKNAKTEADLKLIAEWEKRIEMAENELNTKQALIESQKSEISSKNQAITFMIAMVVVLLAFAGGLYYFLRERKKTNKLLSKWKKDISESINYALRIQKSFIWTEAEVQEVFPKSFVLFMPRDVVSGDFYWVAEDENRKYIAAIDCTGHGVPGAFISSMGNTMLHQIIYETDITEPGDILSELHRRMFNRMRQDKKDQAQDGMDMSLVMLEKGSKKMKYAGAFNPIYVGRMNDIVTLKVDLQGIGGESLRPGMSERKFKTREFDMIDGDMIYQLSDGYMDQFGGPNNEKFNVTRFKNIVIEVNGQTALEQKSAFKRNIKDWMGETRQLDDIMIVGFRYEK